MALERNSVRDPADVVQDVHLGDGEIIVYDPDVEDAWLQGYSVSVEN